MPIPLTRLIILITAALNIWLVAATWSINPWPADAETYYMPAARELSSWTQLSRMHDSLDEERIKWLHGKEYHVAAIRVLQNVMGDSQSLRPLIVLGAICMFGSSLLVFAIGRRLFGNSAALAGWFAFTFSFWSYMYVVFPKHQPQGILFILLTLWFLLVSMHHRRKLWILLLAGLSLGIALFSSTVSAVYLPFVFVTACYATLKENIAHQYFKQAIIQSGIFVLGILITVGFANYPNIIANLKDFAHYVSISTNLNHFYYNQRVLAQWFPTAQMHLVRGGMPWVIHYLLLIIPVLLFVNIVALFKALWDAKNDRRQIAIILAWVILASTPLFMAEFKQVAQYGANYYPVLLGMILLLMALWQYAQRIFNSRPKLIMVAIIYIVFNGFWWCGDVYPSRMATTRISQWLDKHNVSTLYTYVDHPLRRYFVDQLNPSTRERITFIPIQTLIQAKGYVLIPPISTDNVFLASNGDYTYYDKDLVLNNIFTQHLIEKVAVKRFPTIASSVMWNMEEEIIAYRYLMLNQMRDPASRQAYIVSTDRLPDIWEKIAPKEEDIQRLNNGIMTVGTLTPLNIYKGKAFLLNEPRLLKGFRTNIASVGNNTDSLRAFAFYSDDKQPLRIAAGKDFISQKLDGNSLSTNQQHVEKSEFVFNPPVMLKPGLNEIQIYRTGEVSDQNYYLIWDGTAEPVFE